MIKLTKREQETLNQLYTHRCAKEISTEMGISVRTVKHYIGSIYDKLEVQDRITLMANKIKELEKNNESK